MFFLISCPLDNWNTKIYCYSWDNDLIMITMKNCSNSQVFPLFKKLTIVQCFMFFISYNLPFNMNGSSSSVRMRHHLVLLHYLQPCSHFRTRFIP